MKTQFMVLLKQYLYILLTINMFFTTLMVDGHKPAYYLQFNFLPKIDIVFEFVSYNYFYEKKTRDFGPFQKVA